MNLKQSLRIIFRNKTYSILNILGLTVGITAAALILLWVEYMVSYNKAIPNAENIFQIAQHQRYGDNYNTFFVAPGPLSKILDENFPEIKCNSRKGGEGNLSFELENDNKTFSEYGCYMDAPVFNMLGMTFIYGDSKTAFNPANPIVISKQMSEKMFEKENPIGKILKIKNEVYEITGVFNDLSQNTSFKFDWLIPFRILEKEYVEKGWVSTEHWGSNWMSCYVEVQPSTKVDSLNQKLNRLIPEKTNGSLDTKLFIYPILKLRLYADFKDGKETGGGYIKTVRQFFYIGLVILLIACINFMNLATARSQKRALEVGIRKTFGIKRKGLIKQFLGESGMIALISLLLSIGLIYLLLPMFNQLVSRKLMLDFQNPAHSLGLIGIWLVCTVLAGSYPAFYLSSFSPINTLKKQKINAGGSVGWVRKGLVVFQFTIAFILICATTVAYLQIRHGQQRDLGIKKDNLVLFQATDEIKNSYSSVQNELIRSGMTENVGLSDQYMMQIWSNGGNYKWQGKAEDVNPLISIVNASPGLIETVGLKLSEGKDFTDSKRNDVVINRTLAKMMGDEGRIGGRVGQADDVENRAEIIGIVEDFIFNDIYSEKTDPLIIRCDPEVANFLFVRLKSRENQVEALANIKSSLQKFSPNETFDPIFMDDQFESMFQGERLEGKLASLFAGLAIFISCLGLFGLSAFSAEQRTKEIGIRKVLGASVLNVLTLLVKNYMYLILIAFVIGIPMAYYITNKYLQGYAYKISLDWFIFGGVALLIILIAMLTVCSQSLRAATTNPVKSIKTE